MKRQRTLLSLVVAAGMAFSGVAAAHGAETLGAGDVVKPNFSHAIQNSPGKSLVAVEVFYPPGGASLPHTHAKSAFIYAYVVSGSIASKVNDEPEHIYKAGEAFFEEPGSRHPVNRNASKTQPAKLLAVFVVDSNDKELTTPLK
ncbi:cupin domain-containing protein [Cupriavidus sp. CuC1]|uniref:cupin domain-containing protein n=1 Tax=Cupriavidus sp. CuC1 TaxID=3373131 RepID=UPI0037D228F4